jgi:hypothetical protein
VEVKRGRRRDHDGRLLDECRRLEINEIIIYMMWRLGWGWWNVTLVVR